MPLFRAPKPCEACGWPHRGMCAPHDHKAVAARRRLDNHNAKRRYLTNGREVAAWMRDGEVLERQLATVIAHANKERKGVRARAKKGCK